MFNVFAMDEFDREMTIAEKAFDIAMAEAAYLESMIDAKLKINMAKSELKVMTESTTESAQGDLVYLFNEAGKEAEANKEGVFTKVKNAVISFFVSVWNSIQKLFTKEDTQAYKDLQASKEKIKLPMNVKFLADKGEAIANALDTQEPSEGKFGKVAKIIGATVAVGGGVAGATALIKHMGEATNQETEITKGEAVGILEKLKNMLHKFQKSVQGVNDNPNDEGGATGVLNIFKKIGEWIGKAVKAITSKLTGGDAVEDTNGSEENTNGTVQKNSNIAPSTPGNGHTDARGKKNSEMFQKLKAKQQQKKEEKKYGKGTLTKSDSFSGLNDDDQAMFSSTEDLVEGDLVTE